ncbi:MAG TPA: NnrU family protein, partial [Xanthobacteraceae bacterium]
TLRDRRAALIARIGDGPYKALFSIVSALGLALIIYGFALYRATGWIDVWYPPRWTRHVTDLLMWPAVIMILAAYVPGHIKHTLKHPMLAGVKLWAFAHLIANGDLGSIILFGSILAWAVYDRIAVKRREPQGAAVSPSPVSWRNDIVAVVVGTLVYLALGFVFHPVVIGVPAFG